MTAGEANTRDALVQRDISSTATQERSASRSPTSGSHAIALPIPSEQPAFARYAVAAGATLLALAVTYPIAGYLQRVIFVLFWPAVIGAAWFGGLGPAILASALSVLAVDYFLIGPPGQLAPATPDDLIPLAVFLFSSGTVALLMNTARAARRAALQAASQNAELAHELELQAIELEQQLEESQALSEELEQSTEELADRTAVAEAAEQYAKGVLDSIAHPFVVFDADWRFRSINGPAARIFEGTPRSGHAAPIGRVLWDVYPDIIGTIFEREMRRAATERAHVTFEAFYPARGEWSSISCFPLPDGGLATQWTDITGRKRAEETEHYLSRASDVLGSSLDYETTLDGLARMCVPKLADWCAVHVLDPDGTAKQLAVAHVDPAKIAWARELNARYPQRADAPTGVPNVVRTGQHELHSDISDEMLVAGAVDADHLRISRELGLKSALIVPLRSGDRTLGALTLVSAESGRRYTDADLPLATELARRAAVAVERAQLHREAVEGRQRTERLQRITAALAGTSTEQGVTRVVVTNMREGLLASRVAIYRVERGPDGCDALVMMDEGGVSPEMRERFARFALDGESPLADLVRTREAVFVPDFEAFRERFPYWPADARSPGQEAWAGLPLLSSTGAPLGTISLGYDRPRRFDADERAYITTIAEQATQAFERVRLLDTEHQARQSAEEANRAKTQFLATMSHELRTPLNAISGYAELLSLGLRGPTTPEQQEDLGRIMRSQRHLLSVINDILNFARLEAGHVEYHVANIPVADLVADLESLIRPQLAAKQLTFECEQVSRDLVACADLEKVRQVLLNLLANAVKFTTHGGGVRVECAHDPARVYIRVVDTGIGIPTDRRGAIFEPFVQLHRTLAQPAEGTGLGLAISRDLARGMGGELTVESEPGRGSTFTLALARAT